MKKRQHQKQRQHGCFLATRLCLRMVPRASSSKAAVPAFPVEPLNEQNDDLEPLHFPEPEPFDMIPVDEQIEAPERIQHELVN